jgi:N-formylglutamate amidohydrolase
MFEDALPAYVNTRSSRVAAGLGTIARVVSSGQEIYSGKLRFSDAADRIDRLYRPYHRALRDLLGETRAAFGCAVLVDCHSMPSVGGPNDPDAGRRRPDIVLGDCFGAACAEIVIRTVEDALERQGLTVMRNRPFAGGFTTRHYGRPREGQHAIQIEINRGLYMDEARIRPVEGMRTLGARLIAAVEAVAAIDPAALRVR